MQKFGKLIILCGPSGAGKHSIWENIITNPSYNIVFSISCTTRPKREGEVNGREYHFLTKNEFAHQIEENNFLEYATYANNYYGTLKSNVLEKLDQNQNVFLEIEIQGVKQVLKNMPSKYQIITIFIAPPSLEELAKRLQNRKTESMEKINQRLEIAKGELAQKDLFQNIIINDDLNKARQEFKNLLDGYLNS